MAEEAGIETSIDSVEQESRNEQAFYTLLERMRAVAHSERDKGDLFESLMCQVLAIASPYSERFSKVQLYKNWAIEHPECVPNARDIGIDLVATLIEPECKVQTKKLAIVLSSASSTTKTAPFQRLKLILLFLPPAPSILLSAC